MENIYTTLPPSGAAPLPFGHLKGCSKHSLALPGPVACCGSPYPQPSTAPYYPNNQTQRGPGAFASAALKHCGVSPRGSLSPQAPSSVLQRPLHAGPHQDRAPPLWLLLPSTLAISLSVALPSEMVFCFLICPLAAASPTGLLDTGRSQPTPSAEYDCTQNMCSKEAVHLDKCVPGHVHMLESHGGLGGVWGGSHLVGNSLPAVPGPWVDRHWDKAQLPHMLPAVSSVTRGKRIKVPWGRDIQIVLSNCSPTLLTMA